MTFHVGLDDGRKRGDKSDPIIFNPSNCKNEEDRRRRSFLGAGLQVRRWYDSATQF